MEISMEKPLITIITVVYNSAVELERTIKNIIAQTYGNIEFIVVDGGSTDGTLQIIKQYENYITKWISEKDKGPYDAMNKGIQLATGDWINFMNAGDSFYSDSTIKTVFTEQSISSDVIYGGHCYHPLKHQKIIKKSIAFDQIWGKLKKKELTIPWLQSIPCHQSTFVRTDLLKKHKLDLSFKIAADHDFLFKAFHLGYKLTYVDEVIANYFDGGLSRNRYSSYLLELRRYMKKYQKSYFVDLFVLKIFIKSLIAKRKFILSIFNKKKKMIKQNENINIDKSRQTTIFLHIPKTAGTTIQTIINQNFDKKHIYELNNADAKKSMAKFINTPEINRQFYNVILGHMWFGLHESVPFSASYITVLRDPIERIISHYYYVKRREDHYLHNYVMENNLSLSDYVKNKLTVELNNGQTRLLSGIMDEEKYPFGMCTEGMLDKAVSNLKTFFSVVGIQEEFGLSLKLMEKVLGWDMQNIKTNVTISRPKQDQMSEEDIKVIKEFNKLDIQLYEIAKKVFHSMLEKHKIK